MLQVVRYYPYYSMALDLMKRLMCEQSSLSDEAKEAVSDPHAGLKELHEAVGHDHWVVTPCHRSSLGPGSEGRIMEGCVFASAQQLLQMLGTESSHEIKGEGRARRHVWLLPGLSTVHFGAFLFFRSGAREKCRSSYLQPFILLP